MSVQILNRTHLEHAVIAAGVQLLLLLLFWAGGDFTELTAVLSCLPPVFLFFGREHAQAEAKIRKKHGHTTLEWSDTLEALCFWKWSLDAKLDFAFPLVVCILQTALAICWLT